MALAASKQEEFADAVAGVIWLRGMDGVGGLQIGICRRGKKTVAAGRREDLDTYKQARLRRDKTAGEATGRCRLAERHSGA